VLAVRAGTTTSVLRPTIAGCLLVLVAAALEGCAVAGPDRAADVRRNERLLTDVPPYPGARVDGTTSARERDPESGALADNYTTIRTELLSTRIPLRLAQAWYRRHLERHGWRVRTFWDERVAGNPPPGVQAIGRRGKALVEVSLEPLGKVVRVDVLADFLGNQLCRRRTEPGCW